MIIKTFDFLSFEEWNKTQEYTQKIGDYTCKIECVTFWTKEEPECEYKATIANSDDPISSFVHKHISEVIITCNRFDKKTLKEWYHKAVVKLNQDWKRFILETYFYSECDSDIKIPDEDCYNLLVLL